MNVLLFLNELSIAPPEADVRAGRVRMGRFLSTVLRVRHIIKSARPVLHMTDAFDSVQLAANYSIASWRHDSDASRDERLLALQLQTQVPILARGATPDDVVEHYLGVECWYGGQRALGLQGAVATDGLGVSFASAPCWNTALLLTDVDGFDEGGEVVRREVQVRHASSEGHVDTHEAWLLELERLTVRDGNDLWDRREALFPALEFCRELRGQLADFLGGDVELRHVIKRLVYLQRFFETWDGTPVGPDSLPTKCTPESEPTLAKYRTEHTFTLPDGSTRLFTWHVRFTPGAGRIFFFGDAERRKGIIGYIGKDGLPTVKDPT